MRLRWSEAIFVARKPYLGMMMLTKNASSCTLNASPSSLHPMTAGYAAPS